MANATTCGAVGVTVLVLAGGWLVTGCEGYGFEQPYEVTDLRVLAVRVEPAELAVDGAVTVTTLAVDPRSDAPLNYTWEICLFTEGPDGAFACAVTDDGTTAGAVVSEESGFSLTYDEIADTIGTADELCAEVGEAEFPAYVEVPACERGFPLTLRLTVRAQGAPPDAGPESEEVEVAVKQLLLLRDGMTANANPVLDGLMIDGSRALPEVPMAVPDDFGSITLQALVDEASAETHEMTSTDDGDATEREQLQLSWFTTHGRVDHSTTWFDEGRAPFDELRTNTLNLTARRAAGSETPVHMWLVLRDDRGGTDFASFTLETSLDAGSGDGSVQ